MKCLYCDSLILQDNSIVGSINFCINCNINYYMASYMNGNKNAIYIISYISNSIYEVDYCVDLRKIRIIDSDVGGDVFNFEEEDRPKTLDDFRYYLNKFLILKAFL